MDCVYIVFGEAVWDGKPRCALFKTCEERLTYADGDPKVYRKVTTSKVVILIIALDANKKLYIMFCRYILLFALISFYKIAVKSDYTDPQCNGKQVNLRICLYYFQL